MQEIWTKSKPEYHGEFVNFDPMMTWPKPVQKPYPPVILGGAFPHGARRAIAYGDGWVPQRAPARLRRRAHVLPEVDKMLKDAGRDRRRSRSRSIRSPRTPTSSGATATAGIDRVVFELPSAKADEVLPILDRCAKLMQ